MQDAGWFPQSNSAGASAQITLFSGSPGSGVSSQWHMYLLHVGYGMSVPMAVGLVLWHRGAARVDVTLGARLITISLNLQPFVRYALWIADLPGNRPLDG